MYSGTLIDQLIATVERAEEKAADRAREEKLAYWYAVAEAELARFENTLAGVA
ncbi:MAG TPA: hypothetical protein VLW84_06650 [Terriglobales bacterium]|nr:hypothetical protein [Terriglobales bacterium]